MIVLPSAWTTTTFGEVADIQLGKMLDKAKNRGIPTPYLRNVNVRWGSVETSDIQTMPMSEDERSKFRIEDGDLLVCEGGEPGRAAVWKSGPTHLKFQKALLRVRTHPTVVPDWLMHYLWTAARDGSLAARFSGTTIKHLPREALQGTALPLAPAKEQRRIVAKIDGLSANSKRARDHLNHVSRLIQKYKQAFLDNIFSNPEGSASSWQRLPLEMLASVGTGATPKSGDSRYYEGGTIPWVTSGAVNQHSIVHAEKMITEAAVRETNCKVYPPGTLLMAMYGEGLTRGKVAHLSIAAATNQALAAIQVDRNHIHPIFLLWFLHSRYLVLRAQAAGGVQPNLNLGIVKQIEVPCPPVSVQVETIDLITRTFAWIDRLATEASSACKLIDRLDQAILTKAFRGQLVPQDPNDEPASVLLERIRAEMTGPSQPRRGRGRPRPVLA